MRLRATPGGDVYFYWSADGEVRLSADSPLKQRRPVKLRNPGSGKAAQREIQWSRKPQVPGSPGESFTLRECTERLKYVF